MLVLVLVLVLSGRSVLAVAQAVIFAAGVAIAPLWRALEPVDPTLALDPPPAPAGQLDVEDDDGMPVSPRLTLQMRGQRSAQLIPVGLELEPVFLPADTYGALLTVQTPAAARAQEPDLDDPSVFYAEFMPPTRKPDLDRLPGEAAPAGASQYNVDTSRVGGSACSARSTSPPGRKTPAVGPGCWSSRRSWR